MEVIVQDRQRTKRVDPQGVKEWAERILRHLGLKGRELSVLLVEDAEIRELNRRYLGRDRPTNVLAFPMEGPQSFPLGDVVISTETAEREARERGVSLEEEMALLLAHGVLHLLGYDHERGGEEEALMRAKEEELLQVVLPDR
ncbi:MAG: rRNA maturation RNase YbeY [Deltaproteobacteria bacterium]|nr:MAG: rRNA maturation RNase YbeY [Deltaproteobacteria bacterium]